MPNSSVWHISPCVCSLRIARTENMRRHSRTRSRACSCARAQSMHVLVCLRARLRWAIPRMHANRDTQGCCWRAVCYAARPARPVEALPIRRIDWPVDAPTGRIGRSSTHYGGPISRAVDHAGLDSDLVISESPEPEWNAEPESDVGYGWARTGSMAVRGHVPEEPAVQCEWTCACTCSPPTAVTVYGNRRQIERCSRCDTGIRCKPQRCR